MQYTLWQLIGFFFIYGFAGWLLLVVVEAFRSGGFVNVGALNGPIVPSCGVSLALLAWLVRGYATNYVFQFILCTVVCAVTQAVAGRVAEQTAGFRLWNSPENPFYRFGSRRGLVIVLCQGLLCCLVINLAHPFVYILLELLFRPLLIAADCFLLFVFVVDLITSGYVLRRLRRADSPLQRQVDQNLDKARLTLGSRLVARLRARLWRAYPEMQATAAVGGGFGRSDKKRVFAQGYGFYKAFWVFFICALLGDLVETLYCRAVGGVWMSRSSVLYGPFSVVWGGGAALGMAVLEPLAKKSDRYLFFAGFFLGGGYEYLCSVFTEVVFGQVFWDYSSYPLNINGRTSVFFMAFWGVAAVVLVKGVYPLLSRWVERIPPVPGLVITWCLVVFMVLDILVSGLALSRYALRAQGTASAGPIGAYLDEQYPDELVEFVWPNMKTVEQGETE